ncbi:MAG: restriction endonuclease [Acetobacteraceae bacterium]
MTLWLIRHGRDGEFESLALEQGRMLMGFEVFGDISAVKTRAELEERAEKGHADASPAQRSAWVGQIAAFRFDVKPGDHVVMPRKALGTVRIGRVTGPYEWIASNPEWQRQTRKVAWEEPEIPRTAFPADIRASFGTLGTLRRVLAENAEARVLEVLKAAQAGQPVSPADPPPGVEPPPDDLTGDALNFEELALDEIARLVITRFHGHGLSRLVAAILGAEGYVTHTAPPGKDGGVDVLAGQGPFGFERPRIAVQVKSGAGAASAMLVRELRGAMPSFRADHCLFVSWAGFTPDAEKEARQHQFDTRLWTQADLLTALLRNYDRLPADIRRDLPLKRIWAPVRSVD